MGITAAFTAAVLARRYSRNSGHTSDETDSQASGHLLAHDRRRGALVRGVEIGVQEADDHRLHALGPQAAHRRAHLADVERLEHVALGVEPLADLEAPPPRHQGRRLLEVHVVEPGADLAADLQHVAEAARHEHAHARGLALDDGVGRHRGGVHHRGHVAAAGPAFREAALERGHEAVGRVLRRGGHLDHAHLRRSRRPRGRRR